MSEVVQIFVALLDEGVKAWKPIKAKHVHDDTYLIVEQYYDRSSETWEFQPGEKVFCSMVEGDNGSFLAAVKGAGFSID